MSFNVVVVVVVGGGGGRPVVVVTRASIHTISVLLVLIKFPVGFEPNVHDKHLPIYGQIKCQ